MIVEKTPKGESQSNGVSENTVLQIQGHIRTIKDGLEEIYQQKVAGAHPSMPWLVCHSAGVKNKLQVGEDGKTSYEGVRGKPFRGEWVEFGECVWFLKPRSRGAKGLMGRWSEGIWLGSGTSRVMSSLAQRTV